jgi:hypothetical protein
MFMWAQPPAGCPRHKARGTWVHLRLNDTCAVPAGGCAAGVTLCSARQFKLVPTPTLYSTAKSPNVT